MERHQQKGICSTVISVNAFLDPSELFIHQTSLLVTHVHKGHFLQTVHVLVVYKDPLCMPGHVSTAVIQAREQGHQFSNFN